MRARDAEIIAGYNTITVGMTKHQVAEIMKSPIIDSNQWPFNLSFCSDTQIEKSHVFWIYFNQGVVASKEHVYTCIEIRERD